MRRAGRRSREVVLGNPTRVCTVCCVIPRQGVRLPAPCMCSHRNVRPHRWAGQWATANACQSSDQAPFLWNTPQHRGRDSENDELRAAETMGSPAVGARDQAGRPASPAPLPAAKQRALRVLDLAACVEYVADVFCACGRASRVGIARCGVEHTPGGSTDGRSQPTGSATPRTCRPGHSSGICQGRHALQCRR